MVGGDSLEIILLVNPSSVIDVKNGVFPCGTQRRSLVLVAHGLRSFLSTPSSLALN
jgi:hypothetical protein